MNRVDSWVKFVLFIQRYSFTADDFPLHFCYRMSEKWVFRSPDLYKLSSFEYPE